MIKMVFDKVLLKKARIEMGLSQQELADSVGVKVHSIYNWENGVYEPCEENIVKLAQILNIEITQFLIKKEVEPIPKNEVKIKYDLIRKLRLEHKYSQDEFGKLLNISKTTISKWETGKKNIGKKNLLKIAELFHMNLEDFYEKGE